MWIAGLVSGLLGIGSGALKVLAMDGAMRLPMKVSSATSNFMIGVTAAASAGIYLGRGDVDPPRSPRSRSASWPARSWAPGSCHGCRTAGPAGLPAGARGHRGRDAAARVGGWRMNGDPVAARLTPDQFRAIVSTVLRTGVVTAALLTGVGFATSFPSSAGRARSLGPRERRWRRPTSPA